MQSTIQYIQNELKGIYPLEEISEFIKIIADNILNWDYTKLVLNRNEILGSEDFRRIKEIVDRLKQHEPIQYIFGETVFAGLQLKVNPSVLIPRPETEELINWIVDENDFEQPKILDIGTGSGCIALALKEKIKQAKVKAVDISQKAIEVARQNATQNNLDIEFTKADILDWKENIWEKLDIVISNPPYVRELEKKEMNKNVLDFEPDNALYVSNEDPLLYYRKIAEFSQKYLVKGGLLYFEINENLAAEMKVLVFENGFKEIEIRKDLNNKARMLRCKK